MKMLIIILGILFLAVVVILYCCVKAGANADTRIKELSEEEKVYRNAEKDEKDKATNI